ncbi:MAG: hypothetical protein IKP20_07515 [Candidatus Methanomethylophilaceae archaeon]|jgi:hypothetical protein|nr:hypothetical protein [Candidatus Methanomethylophilaceae archaeon]
MDLAGGARLSKYLAAVGAVLFIIGAAVAFFWSKLPGILILIVGLAMLMICFSFQKFFALYDIQATLMQGKKKK